MAFFTDLTRKIGVFYRFNAKNWRFFYRFNAKNWRFLVYIPLSASKFASDFGNFSSKFWKFSKFQNFGKKFPNSEFFSKISKTTKGPPLTSKGAAASLLANYKISLFNWELPKPGVYNIKHNLARSCFILKMEILEFTSKEVAALLMSLAAPLWFWKFWKKF